MIDLYTWGTPNGRKVSVMLEEVGLPYRVHPIDIGKGEQFAPDFLAISPNNKIPAMVDDDGPGGEPLSMFESGAMLLYLARKTGRFLPADEVGHFQVMQWLMFQMGGVGPMFGQAHHFRRFAKEDVPYARDRYTEETKRLYGVMDGRLARSAYLGERRLQHRRHRDLPLGRPLRVARHRLRGRLPQRLALVPDDRGAARGRARLRRALAMIDGRAPPPRSA